MDEIEILNNWKFCYNEADFKIRNIYFRNNNITSKIINFDINLLLNTILAFLKRDISIIKKKSSTRIDFHNNVQKYICGLSNVFNLNSIFEYKVICKNKRRGRMDVIWRNKYKEIICAFEIDGSCRKRSIKKLNFINAKYKIWIIYFKNYYIKDEILKEKGDVVFLDISGL